MSRLPLTINTRFVSTLARTQWNEPVFGEDILGTNRIIGNWRESLEGNMT